ncbi:hydroxysqualene dehydroxylase HpnE [Undibacterium sp.]|uniref:hydroxysqualene dehydroxylase HpnE n=1 Tax=Undibacterium sp. TaxID=1914977 RepID=UPI002C59B5B9|nr:hydroxysqualene dehydroxylase HpnE [Undibacterium sp.]HTD03541.1 hydroxysqualene dehydroxylase HpnE [Undibacterium sp.]
MAKSPAKRIAVIGAGWAGCAAAVELADQGHQVILLEASRTLGGRARKVELQGKPVDNGQHILLGAYSASLRLMRKVGVDTDKALLRLPLQICYPAGSDGMQFVAPRLPAPLHLLWALIRATGLSHEDKMSLARFSTTARWMGWQMHQDCSVSELLQRFDQTDRLSRLMWTPLCIAALNTPPERASAQVFLNVLRDSLGAKRAASDMLIPRTDLSALFPEHASQFVQARGGQVLCGRTVKKIRRDAHADWSLDYGNGGTEQRTAGFDAVIIATGAETAAGLLAGLEAELNGAEHTTALPRFDYEPITTCYLQYDAGLQLPRPFFALRDDPENGNWGQFVFDRGQLDAGQAGLLAVVVSASNDAIELGNEALATAVATQLAQTLGMPALAVPIWQQVISEKRATFSCTPGLVRPQNLTSAPGLLIAGDYTIGEYPATLEAAVRSGIQAAQLI